MTAGLFSVPSPITGRIGDTYLGNVVVEPFSAHFSRGASIVPVVVARHVPEDIVHSLCRDMGEEGLDEVLMFQIGKVYNGVNSAHLDDALEEAAYSLYRPTPPPRAARRNFHCL